MYEPDRADGVIATDRIGAARPLLMAYVIAVGFTLGLLVDRSPAGPAVPVIEASDPLGREHERETFEPPLWVQLFRPSPPTARLMLRMAMPILGVADGSTRERENRNLWVYWTGRAEERPESLLQSILPFVGESEPPPVIAEGPAEQGGTEPPVSPPPEPTTGEPPTTTDPTPPQETPQSDRPAAVNGGKPLVGIYHTHDWESYISEFPAMAVQTAKDLNKIQSFDHAEKTVMDLGKSLAVRLKEKGITSVWADATHQSSGYDYAYSESRETAREILKEHPSVRILLDLHRDAAWGFDSTAVIDGKRVAQIRCIIGKKQPNWEKNKAFCETLMEKLEKKHPGLTLPTRVQGDRYNQDLIPGAILLEIGGAMNSYEEADRAVKLLAEGLSDLIREGNYPK